MSATDFWLKKGISRPNNLIIITPVKSGQALPQALPEVSPLTFNRT
jgi:hypothetical protein